MTFDPSKGPGPGTVERAVAAWQRTQAELAGDEQLQADENAITTALAGGPVVLTPDQLLARTTRALNYAMLRSDECKALQAAASARHERYKRRTQLLRLLLVDLLSAFERKRYDAPDGTVTLRDGTPSLVVTDEKGIPDEYFRTVRSLDRTALAADLKVGVFVPGATMSNGPPTAALRRDKRFTPESQDIIEEETHGE